MGRRRSRAFILVVLLRHIYSQALTRLREHNYFGSLVTQAQDTFTEPFTSAQGHRYVGIPGLPMIRLVEADDRLIVRFVHLTKSEV